MRHAFEAMEADMLKSQKAEHAAGPPKGLVDHA